MTNAGGLPLVLIGAGGHAKVVLSLARTLGREVLGVCDPALAREGATAWRELPVLGDDEALSAFGPDRIVLLNGIGQIPRGGVRRTVHERWTARGFRFATLIHPSAAVDPTATLGDGVLVMAGAIVQADVTIGADVIVNTGARVDHDCQLGDHIHIAPGAVLCGGVRIGDGSFVGASATLLPLVQVGRGCLIAAGGTLSGPLPDAADHLPHRLLPGPCPVGPYIPE